MPLTISAGFSMEIDLPDDGSLGANCQVEFQTESSLPQTDPETIHRQVHNAYLACAKAATDELARQQDQNAAGVSSHDRSP
jgi:hypothetical protein